MSTEELVTRCQAGDDAAFRELFRAHRDDVARLLYRMTSSRAELDDLLQETFLQVHRSIGRFRGQARFSTWLYRVAVNVALMHRRSQKSRPVLVEESDVHVPVDVSLAPDEQVVRARRIRALYRLLDRLSDKKRTVFVLHEIEGKTPAEIGEIVDAPVLTVRTRLFYARRELVAMLGQEPDLAAIASALDESSTEDSAKARKAASPAEAPLTPRRRAAATPDARKENA